MVDKKVCIRCIKNPGVRKKIEQSQHKGVCSYCGVAEWVELLPDVIRYIEKCILYDYDRQAPLSPPGSYNVKDIFETKDFKATTQVRTDIVKALARNTYSLKSEVNTAQSPEKTQALIQQWSQFEQLIKTENRFFCENHKVSFNTRGGEYRPAKILSKIVEAIREHTFLHLELDEENTLYRARSHFQAGSYDAQNLGHPPIGKASATRMTPAPVGIPAFYASLDPHLAVKEIKTTATKFIVGRWKLTRPIRVVNLSGVIGNEAPDFFDYDKKNERNIILFLKKFSSEVSKPVEKDGREHIDYVPTQALSEFIKTYLDDIYGIAYVSDMRSQKADVTIKEALNVALFVEKFKFVDKVGNSIGSASSFEDNLVVCQLTGFEERE